MSYKGHSLGGLTPVQRSSRSILQPPTSRLRKLLGVSGPGIDGSKVLHALSSLNIRFSLLSYSFPRRALSFCNGCTQVIYSKPRRQGASLKYMSCKTDSALQTSGGATKCWKSFYCWWLHVFSSFAITAGEVRGHDIVSFISNSKKTWKNVRIWKRSVYMNITIWPCIHITCNCLSLWKKSWMKIRN